MLTWLEADLQATTADWVIALWHRPPYSKGLLHDSDVEVAEIDMRQFALPIPERYGVDLVLNGHSHSYERSGFLDGHYGLSPTLSPANLLDPGDGDPAGDGAYRKASPGPIPRSGVVFVVNGSGSEVRTASLNHPAMVANLLEPPKGHIVTRAKGAVIGAPATPVTCPVTAQLVNRDSGACWESSFTTSTKNETGKVTAVSSGDPQVWRCRRPNLPRPRRRGSSVVGHPADDRASRTLRGEIRRVVSARYEPTADPRRAGRRERGRGGSCASWLLLPACRARGKEACCRRGPGVDTRPGSARTLLQALARQMGATVHTAKAGAFEAVRHVRDVRPQIAPAP